ncbi:MAG: hypothetical protein NTW28_12870 [Candidatus Solibacter sp.]|nr:hypothetical protein [Candidatus Solibacter sp.]
MALAAHVLDDVIQGISLLLLGVEIESGALDQLLETAPAEDFLPHLVQALLHLHIEHRRHQAGGNLLGSDAQYRLRHVGVGPEERHHHRDHQSAEHRPD